MKDSPANTFGAAALMKPHTAFALARRAMAKISRD
jgi:hypothetical protein